MAYPVTLPQLEKREKDTKKKSGSRNRGQVFHYAHPMTSFRKTRKFRTLANQASASVGFGQVLTLHNLALLFCPVFIAWAALRTRLMMYRIQGYWVIFDDKVHTITTKVYPRLSGG